MSVSAYAKNKTASHDGWSRKAMPEAPKVEHDAALSDEYFEEVAPSSRGAPADVRGAVGQTGTLLPADVQGTMQSRFGQDFSAVRVHTDSRAAASAHALHAKAYTFGNHIVFSPGRFAPHRNEGRRLLAHELAHVVQQKRGGNTAPASVSNGALEAAADRAATAVVGSQGAVSVEGSSAVGVACEPEDDQTPDKKEKAGKPKRAAKPKKEATKAAKKTASKKPYSRAVDKMPDLHDPGRQDDYNAIVGYRAFNSSMGVSEHTYEKKPKPDTPVDTHEPAEPTVKRDTTQGLYGRIEKNRAVSEGQNKRNIDERLAKPREELTQLEVQIDTLAEQRNKFSRKRRTKAGLLPHEQTQLDTLNADLKRERARRTAIRGYIKKQESRTPQRAMDMAAARQRIAAFDDPSRPGEVSKGGAAGSPMDTHVVIRVVDSATGKTVARAFGKFDGADTSRSSKFKKHAEENAIPEVERQLEAEGLFKHGRENDLRGYRVEVVGDREVCAECGPFLRRFAIRNGMDRVDGFTFVSTTPKGKPMGDKPTARLSGLASMEHPSMEPSPLRPQHIAVYSRTGDTEPGGSGSHDIGPHPSTKPSDKTLPILDTPGNDVKTVAPPPKAAVQSVPQKKATLTSVGVAPGAQTSVAHASPAIKQSSLAATGSKPSTPPVPASSIAAGRTPMPARRTGLALSPKPLATAAPAAKNRVPPPATAFGVGPKRTATPGVLPSSRISSTPRRPATLPLKPRTLDTTAQSATLRQVPGPAPGSPNESQAKPASGVTDSSAVPRGGRAGGRPSSTTQLAHHNSAIIAANKTGLSSRVSLAQQQEHGHGVTSYRSAAFDGKAWFETTEIPNTSPQQVKVTFHINLSGQISAGAARQGGGNPSASVSASGQLELSMSHDLPAESARKYVEAASSGVSGGWPELQIGELAVHGNMADAKALLIKLSTQRDPVADLEGMKPGDELTMSAGGSAGGEVGAGSIRGAGSASIQIGYSKSGSVMRHVALRDGRYFITVRTDASETKSAGAGFGLSGIGMNMGGSRDEHASDEFTFVIAADDPQRKDRFAKILGAHSMSELQGVRDSDQDLNASRTRGEGHGKGSQTSASGGPIALSLFEHGDVTRESTEGPDGTSTVYTGTGTGGATLAAGGKTLVSASKTDQFRGGAGPDSQGFGETASTRSETDFKRSADTLIAAGKRAPLRTVAGLLKGDQPLTVEGVHQEGAALTDDSYSQLDALAHQGANAWARRWQGSIGTREAWLATRRKVLDAGGDRKLIAKALAEFEGESDTGRHDTVRTAVGDTAIAFEFPQSLVDQKPLFDAYVVADPVAAAQSVNDSAAELAKLAEARDKLVLLSGNVGRHTKDFEKPGDYIEMRQRIDERKRAVQVEIAKISRASKPTALPGSNQKTAVDKQASVPGTAAPAPEAITESTAGVDDINQRAADTADTIARLNGYRETEQSVFAAMEEQFKGMTLFGHELPKLSNPDVAALLTQERLLKEAYPKWDRDMALLRKLLQDAGGDPSKADAFAPDRKRYLELDAKVPGRGYGSGLSGYKEI